MTRQEAIEAMKKGLVVKHDAFEEGMYFYKVGDYLYDEVGYYCDFDEFSSLQDPNVFSAGWSVIERKKIDHIECASTFLKKLKHELDHLTSYNVPISVDGKLIKDVKLTDDLTIEITTL